MANYDDDVIDKLSEILATALEQGAPAADSLIASYAQRAAVPEALSLFSAFYAELWAVFCEQLAASLAQHVEYDEDFDCPNCDDGVMTLSRDPGTPIGRTRYICGPCGYVEDR